MWRSVTLHKFVNISEEPAASIFYPEAGGDRLLLKVGKFYQTTWCHVKEDWNPNSHTRKITYPTGMFLHSDMANARTKLCKLPLVHPV